MPKIAHLENKGEPDSSNAERNGEQLTRTARATVKAGAKVARESAEQAQQTIDTAEDLGAKASTSVEQTPEVGRAFAELVGEQARQNVDTASTIARAVNWPDVMEAQSRLVAGSLQRVSQFNARYREFLLRGMTAISTSPRR
jgi:hypothetical protein